MKPFDFSSIPPLSAEEEKDPYSKFYYVPVLPPEQYLLDATAKDNPMPREYAMLPSDLGKLFSPGYLPGENGYLIMDNGVGQCAVNTHLPNVTPEMEEFWNSWFRSKDLYYKIWLPGMHFGHQDVISENLGWGNVILKPYSFVDVTKSLPKAQKELDPDFVGIMAGSMYMEEPDGSTTYCSLAHYYRRYGSGVEIRTRSWIGLTIEQDGSYTVRVNPNTKDVLERIRILAMHHAWEFTRKAHIAPQIYEFSKTI